MKKLIKNCTILPMDGLCENGKYYFEGAIAIEGSKISMVTSDPMRIGEFEKSGDVEVIDAKGKIAMPGLINAHGHAAMTLTRGYADDQPLMQWLHSIWPIEAKLTSDDIYWGAKLAVAEMVRSGTTTYVDMYWNLAANAKTVNDTGIRSYFAISVMDRCLNEVLGSIDNDVKIFHNSSGERLKLMIAPHAPYTCGRETLEKSVEIARKYSIMLHSHLCETKDEMRICEEQYNMSPVEYYDSCGVFSVPCSVAHGVYLTREDVKRLKAYNVSVVHNPASNMKLSSGAAPITMMLEEGLNVALGTDGASSNNNLDMFQELRTASFLQKLTTENPTSLNAYDTLYMATVGGAKALGRENDLGRLKEGMKADIILINAQAPHLNPLYNIVTSLVYSGTGSDVTDTMVDGRFLMRDGKLTTINIDECVERVNKFAEAIK